MKEERIGFYYQDYEYDSLNRLTKVTETSSAAWQQQYAQGYTYDRWGNRQIDSSRTWGTGINSRQFTIDASTNRLYAPSGGMGYDHAGNLTQDTYSADAAQRTYDAENRMTTEQSNATSIFSRYTYDADGRRTRRDAGGNVTWQVYGFGGELPAEYPQNGTPAQPRKEYGYRAGELLVTASPAQQSANAAAFVRDDTTTQGAWQGTYGADGYNVLGDAANYPAYAQVSVTGQNAYTWAASTSEARALQKSANPSDRVASCWFSGTSFDIDVNLTDGATHRVAFYALDWDYNNGRAETVEVQDAATNAVLDTRAISAFGGGRYLVWDLRGHVRLHVTSTGAAGTNAVAGGLFFGDPHAPLGSFVTSFYASILNRWPTGAEMSSGVSTLTSAMSQGQTAFLNAASSLGQSLFFTQEYANRGRTDHWFVYDLYEAFCGREPDAGGWAAWEASVPSQGRANILYGSSSSSNTEWAARSNTQYGAALSGQTQGVGGGSVNWLVADRLGTPRMVADQTGSMGGVKRHDYMPFGEELTTQGGRTAQQGYSTDAVRQKFTAYERDAETGLDFVEARYHSNTLGRFTSIDPSLASAKLTDPQTLSRCTCVRLCAGLKSN